MDRNELISLVERFVQESGGNSVAAEKAILPEYAGKRLFETPLLGFASADDPLFTEYKNPEIIGPHFLAPKEWMLGCKTVISFFLPFTKEVVESNAQDFERPSDLWLHARIEGQEFVKELTEYLIERLNAAGYEAMSPSQDSRIFASYPGEVPPFSTKWAERHVAYAAGLGTFGLSRGLITEKGMAGRVGSVLTTAEFSASVRNYSEPDEYCTKCGACVKHCPASAISLEGGKKNPECSAFLDETKKEFKTRYGCGKCQVKVPCTYRIPQKARRVD